MSKEQLHIDIDMLIEPQRVVFPVSWVGHIPLAAWLIAKLKPSVFVELGTHTGNSYLSCCQTVEQHGLTTRCYAVDTWQGDEHAGHYSHRVFDELSAYHNERYSRFSQLLRMTFDDAQAYFSDASVDLLHIDGLHTYDAVKHDFETWQPKLSSRAVVLFHDTNVRERGFGVWQLWDELSAQYPHMHFPHSHGLGVLFVGRDIPPAMHLMLERYQQDAAGLQRLFAHLGDRIVQRYERQQLQQAVEERDQRLKEYHQVVMDRDKRIAEQAADLADNRETLTQCEAQLVQTTQRLNEQLGSTSWRITRPLRETTAQFKHARQLAGGLTRFVQQRGGPGAVLKKTWSLYRQEGWGGLTQSVQRVVRRDIVHPARHDYSDWVARYDTLTPEVRQQLRDHVETLPRTPLISVVMPTYNPNPDWLIEAIESVRQQLYPHWQLCIADDASTDPAIRPILERYAQEDDRIKVIFRERNGHISATSNSALTLASGEWIALLDHDDCLAESALFWVADAINQDPQRRLIYSDEDKIDAQGQRFDPYFKTDWNEGLFYSQNLITHLGVYHTELVRRIGGFREGVEGAQDYDLALRCIEHLTPAQIHHVPRVLYHWRVHAESTAQSSDAKPYAMIAGEKALQAHLDRQGVQAKATLMNYGYRVQYALPEVLPKVSLIIPTRNGLQLTRQCIESIVEKTTYPDYEIIVIDNGSDDPDTLRYFETLKADDRIRVIRDERPFNYSALNNAGVKQAHGDIIGLLNNDLEVISPEWLTEMVSHALRPEVGAVGARLWYPDDTLQHGGVILGIGGWAGHAHKGFSKGSPGYVGRMSLISDFSAVTAACLVVQKNRFEAVGGLNETELQVACNDVDLCLRLREAGYRNVFTPYADLYHHESATRGFEDTPEKKARFEKERQYMIQRWGSVMSNDPAYNPNLTLDHEDFSLAWPPRVAPVPERVD
ncbi:MAG TPA: hypothetical protein DD373_09825 [Halomonas sp.]|jgi:glycosyltransferase involved in cell wall biosynthesis|nr:hypothetical protein [Halomonas sp.]|tara:strand:+ start:8335 stop:11169 length:2835 start_codon:yes stop_codon:yes gene_type:complete